MTAIRAQALRFMTVGVANTLCGLGVIYAGKWFGGLGDVAANALGYAVGVGLGFLLNRQWTFRDRGGIRSALGRYLVVIAAGYAINLSFVLFLVNAVDANAYLAQAAGIPPYFLFVYVASQRHVFRNPRSSRSRAERNDN